MDLFKFATILAVGVVLVVLQGFLSWLDGYFTEDQMAAKGIRGWAFMQHGGMWADIFIVSPIVAYVLSRYELHWKSWWGLVIALLACGVTLAAMSMYARAGLITREAHTHDGRTTPAGWVHGLYMAVGIWVVVMYYFTPISPTVSVRDLLVVSVLLTVWAFLGVAKFSPRWEFDATAKVVVGAEVVLLWIVTGVRVYFR